MARRYLRLTPETTWGTYNNAGTAILVDLDTDNSYTVRPKPVFTTIRTAGAQNRRAIRVSTKTGLAGNLNMLLHGSQGVAIASWITAQTGPALPSMTIDYAVTMDDVANTIVYSRHLGMMVAQAQVQCSEQSPVLRLALQLIGKTKATITITDFAAPAATDYAGDPIYLFNHLNGAFTLGSARTEFDAFNLTIKNMLDARFFANSSPTRIRYCGRDVDLSVQFPYIVTVDRTDYEANTPVAVSGTFTNGSHTLALAFNTQNYYDGVEDELSEDKVYLQTCSMQSFWDPSAGTPSDFAITGT